VRAVDTEIDMIVEFPLAVVVDNLIPAWRDKPQNTERVAKMMLGRELKEKATLAGGILSYAWA
jgi:hypothetical protein